jgi:hypothetical protein
LKTKRNVSKTVIAQQATAAKAMKATSYANDLQDEANREPSNTADLLSRLYVKESNIVKKIRKLRK